MVKLLNCFIAKCCCLRSGCLLPFRGWGLLLFLFAFQTLNAQYNSEWIDYAKTYYKFKVGSTGLYRIPQNTLSAAGLANIPAEQFQLWRNGLEQPLYTSVPAGILPANGYLEFWGEQNDGKPDKALYKNPLNQLSDVYSLETDTAAYFLTINTSSTNLRLTDELNDVEHNNLGPEPYFIHNYRVDFKQMINRGKAVNGFGEYVYSSTYDVGEFWSSYEIHPGSALDNNASNLYVASSGPAASLQASIAGNSYLGGNRTISVSINGTVFINDPLPAMEARIVSNKSIPLASIAGNTASFKIVNNSANTNDRIVVGFLNLSYPRLFNFGGSAGFSFMLPAASEGNYLEISNFNSGNSIPVLCDLTNHKRYLANTSAAGILKFALKASATQRKLVLVSEDVSNIKMVNSLMARNFINFASASNQGDYLIISNKILFASAGNPVEAYRQYRSESAGGAFNAKIYDINELIDQFAFGIKKHPLGIKNFLKYARQNFSIVPKFVFLIGKAVAYDEYRYNESTVYADQLNLIPSFGWPASDNILASDNLDPIPATPIGRLSAVNMEEVKIYLEKIKLYEQQQSSTIQTIENKAWMKTVVHVTGANSPGLDDQLSHYLKGYENIIQDTLFGANVYNFNKTSTGPVTPITNAFMSELFNKGISMLNYFGHSSSTALDYNLNDPEAYNNYGKYPLFLVNGCNAGNFYSYDVARLSLITSIAERFVLAKDRGAIGLIGSTHFGVPTYLDAYNLGFYKSLSLKDYNQSVLQSMIDGQKYLLNLRYLDSTTAYLHAEETILHGDPALKVNAHAKPDFVVEESQVNISPAFISVADKTVQMKAFFYNIGKATGDSVLVSIKRQYPNGTTETVVSKNIASVRFKDSIMLDLPIIASRDKGENKLIVSIDDNNRYDELSETNNSVTKSFFIYEDELKQVFPYDLSIVNKNNIKLVTSTANPVSPVHSYVMEMDTTALFNSANKTIKNISSGGGIIEFEPGIAFSDSTVYYWRVAPIPSSGPYHWNTSSFLFLNGNNSGFNQSHLYQHLQSSTNRIYIDSTSRQWQFQPRNSALQIIHSIFPTSGNIDADFQIQINGQTVTASACLGHSIIFNVFDPVTLQPLYNQKNPSTHPSGSFGNFMGSAASCDGEKIGTVYNFEFSFQDTTGRRKIRDFMDWIPNGYLVTARLILDKPYDQNPFVNTWKQDEQVYGAGNTLYQRLKTAGFPDLDSFDHPRTWVFIYKKNTPSFNPFSQFSQGLYDRILISKDISSPDTLGIISSPVLGPAKSWQTVQWNGKSLDATAGDKVMVDVIGIDANGHEQALYSLSGLQQNFDISSVSTVQFPFIKLKMYNQDSIHLTPYQLRYWRVLYDPVPEGALAANIKYVFKDTVETGEKLDAVIAFKNVSDYIFSDSIKVKLTVYDKNNVATVVPVSRLKKLNPGDTALISFSLNSKDFTGMNTLFLDVNPENDQPEQYHFNNFLYKNFYVKGDNFNPLMDVTFDGVHILNNDIVSSKPVITIKLRDESKYLILDDTSLISVQLRYPDQSLRKFNFTSDTLRFNPATPGAAENVATADFSPYLTMDGTYELIVKGKDKSGNSAGYADYSVTFQVINKPMISNMFNYPNPFTTSTAFVFTITGSEPPQNLRIQILTITGKIVKEITKAELGPLHIGRNITEYKWDGTDQYGQKLANGVYIYRVITNLNGKSLDKFNTTDSNGNSIDTDKYFNKGYGKMYLMR